MAVLDFRHDEKRPISVSRDPYSLSAANRRERDVVVTQLKPCCVNSIVVFEYWVQVWHLVRNEMVPKPFSSIAQLRPYLMPISSSPLD